LIDMDKFFRAALFILSFAILFFLIAPTIKILSSLSLTVLNSAIINQDIRESIFLTIKMSMYATIIVFVTGIPLAYLLARKQFCCKALLEGVIDIPIMIPHVAAGIALLMVFGSNGSLGKSFAKIGIEFLDTQFGILIAMMFVSAPFLINAAKEGFKKVDVRLENVSLTLGANSFWTFLKITLPNARKDIINGALMMWGRGIGEFGAVVIIAYHPMTAPVMIYDRFNSFGLDYALPVTVIMILVSVAIFALIRVINNLFK
jgi:molybdate/tungstate transport system permease protein